MIANQSFNMRISPREKVMLATVAKHFERTQADTLKAFIRETYQLLQAEKAQAKPSQNSPVPAG
jgi:hypothetical protein